MTTSETISKIEKLLSKYVTSKLGKVGEELVIPTASDQGMLIAIQTLVTIAIWKHQLVLKPFEPSPTPEPLGDHVVS